MSNRAIIAYVPVLDQGYANLFSRNYDANIFIFGDKVISWFDHLRKDIRRLNPELMVIAVKAITGSERVALLSEDSIREIRRAGYPILMPDEDVCRELAKEYFPSEQVRFEFLGYRYDKQKTLENKVILPNGTITQDQFSRAVLRFLEAKAKKSMDWWRQVGAALVKNGEIFLWTINKPTPDHYALLHMGDPRGNYKKGQYVEFSNVLHAEAGIITAAANQGISTQDADLYCTDFPCPPCSRVVAYSGIRRFFYKNGYAMLDGDEIMRSRGIEIIQIT